MYVEFFKGKGVKPYRFRLVADNNKVVSQSQGYVSRWNAKRAVRKALVRDIIVALEAAWEQREAESAAGG